MFQVFVQVAILFKWTTLFGNMLKLNKKSFIYKYSNFMSIAKIYWRPIVTQQYCSSFNVKTVLNSVLIMSFYYFFYLKNSSDINFMLEIWNSFNYYLYTNFLLIKTLLLLVQNVSNFKTKWQYFAV